MVTVSFFFAAGLLSAFSDAVDALEDEVSVEAVADDVDAEVEDEEICSPASISSEIECQQRQSAPHVRGGASPSGVRVCNDSQLCTSSGYEIRAYGAPVACTTELHRQCTSHHSPRSTKRLSCARLGSKNGGNLRLC